MFHCPSCHAEIYVGRKLCSHCGCNLENSDEEFKKETLRTFRYRNVEYCIFTLGGLMWLISYLYLGSSHAYYNAIMSFVFSGTLILHLINTVYNGISTTRSGVEPFVQFKHKPIAFLFWFFLALCIAVILMYGGINALPR
jgi:hypothetical protein